MSRDTTTEAFFETIYSQSDDPWQLSTSPYEQGRYAATLRAIEGHRYKFAFEPGCSIGILTERLAAICDHVEAMDISPTAVAKARQRCRSLSNVNISQGALPYFASDHIFDLIVLSEIGYYMEAATLSTLAASLVEQLTPGGTLLAVHWLGNSPDHVLSGDQVHEILGSLPGLTNEESERYEGFRLDCWLRQ